VCRACFVVPESSFFPGLCIEEFLIMKPLFVGQGLGYTVSICRKRRFLSDRSCSSCSKPTSFSYLTDMVQPRQQAAYMLRGDSLLRQRYPVHAVHFWPLLLQALHKACGKNSPYHSRSEKYFNL
jgi:hypothetical protein